LLTGSAAGSVRAFEQESIASETAGKRMTAATDTATSRMGGMFTKLGQSASNMGIPFANVLTNTGKKLDEADSKAARAGQTFSMIGGAAVVAGVGIAAYSVKLGESMQAADASIASHEGISTRAATSIGNAFLRTAGILPESGQELAGAFASVAGVFEQLNGKALTDAQSLLVMRNASNLAVASGESLSDVTTTLAKVMQSFQIPISGTTKATDQLWSAARITGNTVSALGQTIVQLHSRLGIATPTLGDLSALLVDLSHHGIAGARGLRVVNTAVTNLMASVQNVSQANAKAVQEYTNKVVAAQSKVTEAQTRLQAAQAKQSQATTTNAQTNAAYAVTEANQALADAQTNLNNLQQQGTGLTNTAGVTLAQLGVQVYNTQGNFVGFQGVLTQLYPKLVAMTKEQRLSTLGAIFGNTAAKAMYATVMAGPAAFDRAAKAVNAHNAAAKAAAKQMQTLHWEERTMIATLKDLGASFGQWLIPKLQSAGHHLAEVIAFFEHHKAVAKALAAVIAGVLTAAVLVFSINVGTKMAHSVGQAIGTMAKMGRKLLDLIPNFGEAEAAEGEFAATSEETGAASSAAFGPFGLAIMGVILVGTLLVTHWKSVERIAKTVWHGVQNTFDTFWRYVRRWGPLVIEVIAAPFTMGMSLILPVIIRHWNAVENFFRSIPGRILRALGDPPRLLWDAGVHILEGLLKGIESGVGKIGSLMKKVGGKILHGITSFFGVFSPSRVFADVGKNLMEGLAQGVTVHTSKAVNAMNGAARAVAGVRLTSPTMAGLGGAGAGSSSAATLALEHAFRSLTQTVVQAGHTIHVNATTNASAHDIASEVGWQLRLAS
jgi:hypothetical protein